MREQAGTESSAWRGTALALAAWVAVVAGCSSEGPPVIVQLPAANGQVEPTTFDVTKCQHYAMFEILERACIVDSYGRTYPMNGNLWLLPQAPPYAGFIEFSPGWAPLAQDLDTTSDIPAILVEAAPAALLTPPSSADNGFRPPVQVEPVNDRGLLITVTDPLPVGDELSMILYTGPLYKDRTNPCTLPTPSFCTNPNGGFGTKVEIAQGAGGGAPPPPR